MNKKIKIFIIFFVALIAFGINSKVNAAFGTIAKSPTTKNQSSVKLTGTITAGSNEQILGYIWTNSSYTPSSSSSWKTYSFSNCNNTVSRNGTYYLHIKYKKMGNIYYTKTSTTVTNISPTFIINKSTSNNAVKLSCSPTFNTSISSYAWYKNSTATTPVGRASTYTATANGSYYLTVTDKYGNSKTNWIGINNIDTTKPTIQLTPSTKSSTNKPVTITAELKDTGGLKYYLWSKTSAKPTSWKGVPQTSSGVQKSYKTTQKVTKNETWYLHVKDVAGNYTCKSYKVTNIDTTKPTIQLTPSTKSSTNKSVTITAELKDTGGLKYYLWSKTSTKPTSWKGVPQTSSGAQKSYKTTQKVTKNEIWYLHVKDVAGNYTYKSYKVTNIDTSKPTVKLNNPPSSWTNSVTLTATAKDSGGSGLAKQAYSWNGGKWTSSKSIKVTENKTYTVRVKDNAGNISDTKSIKVTKIDAKKPTVVLTTTNEINKNSWTNKDITLTASAKDSGGSGLAKQAYSWNGGQWTSNKTFKATENKTYTVRVKDNAGNISEAKFPVKNIDKKEPTINSLTETPTGATNKDVTLTVNATDTGGSGLAEQAYSWDGGKWTSSNTFKATANKTYTVRVRDKVGNSITRHITVSNIDTERPTISSITQSTTEWTKEDVTLTVKATDSGSGLAESAYSWDKQYEWGTKTSKTITENGTYAVYVRDKASNVSGQKITITNIDKEGPTIDLVPSTTGITAKDITLTVKATDSGSGLAEQAYSWDEQKTWGTEASKIITENGTYVVYVSDKLGNISRKEITISNIDRTVPIIDSITPSTTEYTTKEITLTVNVDSNESELAESPYSWDGTTWGTEASKTITENGTYTVYVKNKNGKIASESIVINNIYLVGDINDNKEVDITDLLLLKRHIVSGDKKEWVLTGKALKAADMNLDGKVDITDLLLLKRKLV